MILATIIGFFRNYTARRQRQRVRRKMRREMSTLPATVRRDLGWPFSDRPG